MAILLDERKGISSGLLYVLAAIAGITVANLYYNQPLLDMIRVDLEASEMEANHIALFTQLGYALGLLFIIPLADLYSRKRIVLVNFSVLTLSLLGIAMAGKVYWLQFFSLLTGICSVIPQIFVPFAAQYSRPEEKGKNVGMVVSGLLTGILLSRVVSGYVGDWLGWREMYYIASGLMVLSAIVILIVGYVLGKKKFHGKKIVYFALLLTMIVPGEMLMVTNYKLVSDLGWTNRYAGMILPGIVNITGIFLIMSFMNTIPNAVLESAEIDGAGELTKLFRIVLPMALPVLSTYTGSAAWRISPGRTCRHGCRPS